MFANVELKYEKRYFWSFIWALVLVTDLICVSFFLVVQRDLTSYTSGDYSADLIREFEQVKKTADVSVVMLGNSRLRHASTFGFHPDKTVTLPDGRTAAGIMFAQNAARFLFYEGFAHRLLQAEPDLIVFQDSVISNSLGQGPTFLKVSEIIYDYYYKLVTRYDAEKAYWDDRLWILQNCNFAYNKGNADMRVAFMEKDQHSLSEEENENYRAARQFLRKARAQGTKVVIISMIPFMEHFDRQGVPLDVLDFHGLGYYPTPEQLLPEMHKDFTWVRYEDPVGEAHFCDDVHFNDDGRALFMDWYLGNIAKWVPPK